MGYYCPRDSIEPVPCPRGYYCPLTKYIIRCPAGQFCPMGSIKPLSCLFSNCLFSRPGSDTAVKVEVFIVIASLVFLTWLLFKIYKKRESYRFIRHKLAISDISTSERTISPLANPYTIEIEFSDLGLVVGPGIELMRGVCGTLKAGRLTAILGPSGAGKSFN
jgi:ABC-type multidrug transport system fused ATPase/permease subunit